MPPKKDRAHRHPKQGPHKQRKSKPKFEIPLETRLPGAPVGWVYRADEVPATPAPRQAEELSKLDSMTSPFLVAGMGVFLIGVATIGLVSLFALGLIAAPIGITQGMLTSN
jgi:hypothetical protein